MAANISLWRPMAARTNYKSNNSSIRQHGVALGNFGQYVPETAAHISPWLHMASKSNMASKHGRMWHLIWHLTWQRRAALASPWQRMAADDSS